MIWNTADGRSLKIRDITSAHLTNILHHIESNKDAFYSKYGKTRIKKCKHNILQEIRFRKLNRINTNKEEENLF
jgi:hypothetical protein